MYRIDYDSSDDEYFDEWSSSFDKKPVRKYEEKPEEETPLDVVDVERLILNACISGDIETIKRYYKAENSIFNVNYLLVGNYTILMQAASYAQNHIVEYILGIGANPNASADGVTALMCACASPSEHNFATLECVKLLIDKKALINVGDRYGVTPLMRAVMCNKTDVINLLIRNNVNIEMRNNIGRTAIFYAVEYKLPEILKILIKSEACLDNVDRRGFTISMLAKFDNSDEILNIIKEFLPNDEEEEDYVISTASDGLSWRDMLPYTSVSTNRPAFSHEIPGMINGMDCERLEPFITAVNMNLATFLTLDDEALKSIGVALPYERRKLLSGLHSFHLYGWKTASVLGLTDKRGNNFDALRTLDILSCHMKNVTILKSTIDYCINRSKELGNSNNIAGLNESQLVKEVDKSLKELLYLKQHIKKINKNNLPPADLIIRNNPLSVKSFKKTKLIVCSTSILVLMAFLPVRFRIIPFISNCMQRFI